MPSSKKNVFIVCGPTAIGKTAVSIELAKYLKTEIINADSRQIYTELNIGVAKPSATELASVKHHLVGTMPITRLYGAGDFEKDALNITQKLFEKYDSVVMCGGTGMYIKAFCEGLDDLPKADEAYREMLRKKYISEGIKPLQEELQLKDPAAVSLIDFENPQRLMRALEIMHAGGKKYSEVMKGNKAKRGFNIVKIGITNDREILYKRINARVDEMMHEGLLHEVKSLRAYRSNNALKTVGYNELFDYLEGKMSLGQAVDKIKQHTRNYAKRQMTWFRADAEITWFDAHNKSPEALLGEIITFTATRLK